MSFRDLLERWLPQAEVANWDGFAAALADKLAAKEQDLTRAAEQQSWSLTLAGEFFASLPGGVQIKPVGRGRCEKRLPGGAWVKADPRKELANDDIIFLQTLTGMFAEVTELRQAQNDLPDALAEFRSEYQKHLTALRATGEPAGADEVLAAAREFYAAERPLLPAAARREFLGAKQQLRQARFEQARPGGETTRFRKELLDFFERHRDAGETIPDAWHEDFEREEHCKDYRTRLEAMRNAATVPELEQARKALDSLIRQHSAHLPPEAREVIQTEYEKARQNFPPDLPARLKATRTNDDGISVSWDKAPGAAEYLVYRGDSGAAESRSDIGSVNAPATSFLDTGVEPGRDYYYWVTARNPTAQSDFTGPVTGRMVPGRPDSGGPSDREILAEAKEYADEPNPEAIAELRARHPALAAKLEPWLQLAQKRVNVLDESAQLAEEGDVVKMAALYLDDLAFANELIDFLFAALDGRIDRSRQEMETADSAGQIDALKAIHREVDATLKDLVAKEKDPRRKTRIRPCLQNNLALVRELDAARPKKLPVVPGPSPDETTKNEQAAREQKQKYLAAIAAANTALASSDFAEALKQADLALESRPADPEATKLRRDATAGQTFQSALAEGRTAYSSGDFAGAIRHADIALQARPGDPEAGKVKDDAATAQRLAAERAMDLRRQEALRQIQTECDAAGSPGELELVEKGSDRFADLSGDAKFKELSLALLAVARLRVQSEQQTQLDQKYQEAIAAGRAALDAQDVAGAIRQAEIALELKPGDPEAGKLKDEGVAAQRLSAERAAEQRRQEALRQIKLECDAARTSGEIELIEKGFNRFAHLSGDPKFTESSRVLLAAARLRVEFDQQTVLDQKYDQAMADGRAALNAEKFAEAILHFTQAIALRPGDADARKLKDSAEPGQKFQAALTEGRKAYEAGDFGGAIRHAEIALALKPADLTVRKLREDARRAQSYRLELAAGDTALAAGKFAEAIPHYTEALAARPGDPEAQKRLEEAGRGLKYQQAMDAGRTAFKAEKFSEAIAQADLALAARPDDPAARALKEQAAKELARIEQEAARTLQYELAKAAGRLAAGRGEFDDAIRHFSEALVARPKDPEVVELLKFAEAGKSLLQTRAAASIVPPAVEPSARPSPPATTPTVAPAPQIRKEPEPPPEAPATVKGNQPPSGAKGKVPGEAAPPVLPREKQTAPELVPPLREPVSAPPAKPRKGSRALVVAALLIVALVAFAHLYSHQPVPNLTPIPTPKPGPVVNPATNPVVPVTHPITQEQPATNPPAVQVGISPTPLPPPAPVAVSVTSTPRGVKVSEDGQTLLESTPGSIQLLPGHHTLRLTRNGYAEETRSLEVLAGQSPAPLDFTLRAIPVDVTINSTPDQASIWNDKTPVEGLTPQVLSLLPGRYALTLKRTGYGNQPISFEVTAGQLPFSVNSTLTPDPVFVTIDSRPPGATVWSGDAPIKNAVTPVRLQFSPGYYSLTLKLPGYQNDTESFEILAGQSPTTKVFALHAGAVQVSVSSSPAGASVWEGGQQILASTPGQIPLAPGRHNLTLTLANYNDYPVPEFTIAPGQTPDPISATLNPKLVTVPINSFPSGASVWVDGQFVGNSTPTSVQLVPGSHNFRLSLASYQDYPVTQFTVTPGQPPDPPINPTLTPIPVQTPVSPPDQTAQLIAYCNQYISDLAGRATALSPGERRTEVKKWKKWKNDHLNAYNGSTDLQNAYSAVMTAINKKASGDSGN